MPHPRLHERLFALEPLYELDPALDVPGARQLAEIIRGYNQLMSHLDDLDEYEAELELQLKKEYSAVFPLFRFCVLTPDTTYLCNKVELVPRLQQAYPLFEVEMETSGLGQETGRAGSSRGTRIFTSGDVTVESFAARARSRASPPTRSPSGSARRSAPTTRSTASLSPLPRPWWPGGYRGEVAR